MNPTNLYNPTTGILATPNKDITSGQYNSAIDTGFNQTLNTANLTQSPAVKIPEPTPSQIAGSIINDSASQVALQRETQQKALEAQNAKSSATSELSDTMQKIFDVQNSRSSLEQATGIDQKTNALNEINKLVEAKSLAVTRQLEDIQNNKGGQFGTMAGVSDAYRLAQREGARELADLSIIQNARNNDLLTAQKLVDRKITLQLEPLQQKLEYQKMFYEDNKADFTKKEDRQFQLALQKSQREYDAAKEQAKTLEETKLQVLKNMQENGASLQAMQDVQSKNNVNDVVLTAGNYGIDAKRIAEIAKLRAEAPDKKAANMVLQRVSQVDPASPTYIQDLIAASAGGPKLTGDQTRPISKALTVVGQIGELSTSLKGIDTGPIVGILNSSNPYNVQAQLIKAHLQAIIPNLARGVYGEVGVLTDNDIANYRQTIGNLQSPEQLNNLLLSMTLNTVKKGIEDQLEVAASAGRDVSGFKNLYSRLNGQIDTINSSLGIKPKSAFVEPTQADQDYVNSLPL